MLVLCSVLQGEVSAECGEGGGDFEQIAERLRQDIENNAKSVPSSCILGVWLMMCFLSSSDLSAVKGSLPFFRKSLEKIHSTRKCPLCTRGFDDNASFERTIKSVYD